LISVNGEYRWLYQFPPLVGHPVVGGGTKLEPEKAGAVCCACAAVASAAANSKEQVAEISREPAVSFIVCSGRFFR
jgi:hypothetical protein